MSRTGPAARRARLRAALAAQDPAVRVARALQAARDRQRAACAAGRPAWVPVGFTRAGRVEEACVPPRLDWPGGSRWVASCPARRVTGTPDPLLAVTADGRGEVLAHADRAGSALARSAWAWAEAADAAQDPPAAELGPVWAASAPDDLPPTPGWGGPAPTGPGGFPRRSWPAGSCASSPAPPRAGGLSRTAPRGRLVSASS